MRKPLLLFIAFLLITYILILLSYLSTSCIQNTWCGQDMDQYIDYSNSLLAGKGYAAQKVASLYFVVPEEGLYVPETMRLPAYSLVLTGLRLLYDSPHIIIYLNLFCLGLILFYSYKIFQEFLPKWGVVGGFACLLLSPTLFYYLLQGNVDLFVYAFLTPFVYYAWQLYKGDASIRNILLVSFLGVITLFSRQNTLLFLSPFLVIVFSDLYFKQKKKDTIFPFVTIASIFVLFLCVWVTRNYMITKSFTLSTLSSLQLFTEHIYFTHTPSKERDQLYNWLYTEKAGEKYMKQKQSENVSIPVSFVSLNKIISQKTKGFFLSRPMETFYQFRFAFKSLFLDTTFTWEKKDDVMAYLRKIEQKVNPLLLFVMIYFPILFFLRKNIQNFSFLIALWISALLYLLFSAFYHGTVIGNRGILPIYTLLILFLFVFSNTTSSFFKKKK